MSYKAKGNSEQGDYFSIPQAKYTTPIHQSVLLLYRWQIGETEEGDPIWNHPTWQELHKYHNQGQDARLVDDLTEGEKYYLFHSPRLPHWNGDASKLKSIRFEDPDSMPFANNLNFKGFLYLTNASQLREHFQL
jgi:hypothetical protein